MAFMSDAKTPTKYMWFEFVEAHAANCRVFVLNFKMVQMERCPLAFRHVINKVNGDGPQREFS